MISHDELADLIAKLTDKEQITPEDLASIENPREVLVALQEISSPLSEVTIEEEGAIPNQQSTNTDAATENMFQKLDAIISGLKEVVERKALEMADVATGLQQVTGHLATAVQDPTATLADLLAQVANGGRTSH
jgi:ribosomal protein S12 methylthiotransferase accessory factor YcaO